MLLLTPRAKIESSFYLVIGDDPIVFVGGRPQVRSRLPSHKLRSRHRSTLLKQPESQVQCRARCQPLPTSPVRRRFYKPLIKAILSPTETELLHAFIKGSAIETIGDSLRKTVQPISDPHLLKYLDESIRCAETNCIRASVVLAWCAVAFRVHQKLVSLTMPVLTAEFAKMKVDKGLMFKSFQKDYTFTTDLDVQEAADAHLILICRFLMYLDDTQYKHLKNALDLRNGCGHPTGYQPDPVKLQGYYSDIAQLVLLNPKFA